MYKRALIKLSGEALASKSEPICFDIIEKTARELIQISDLGVELGLVLGGGNIWRGRSSGDMDRSRADQMDRSRADQMGMLSTAINSLAMQDMLIQMGKSCAVLSALEMPRVMQTYTSQKTKELFASGHIIIFACGTGHPFFSTDTAAALRAAEMDAQILLLAKNMEYICSDDPKKNPNALKYKHISYNSFIAADLQAMDQTAVSFCRDRKLPIRAFKLSEGNIFKAAKAQDIGTLIDDTEATVTTA